MQWPRIISTVGHYLWGILVSVLVFAAGLVTSRMVFAGLGISVPRIPEQAAEAVAGYYLIAGSAALTIGLLAVARRIDGTYWKRWLVLATFLFVCFGVNGSIEFSIHSSTT